MDADGSDAAEELAVRSGDGPVTERHLHPPLREQQRLPAHKGENARRRRPCVRIPLTEDKMRRCAHLDCIEEALLQPPPTPRPNKRVKTTGQPIAPAVRSSPQPSSRPGLAALPGMLTR